MNEIIFYQLFEPETGTYTYLIADKASQEAALIDPVLETIERDLQLVQDLGVQLKYVLDTHIHADHITAAGAIRERTKAQTVIHKGAQVDCADLQVSEGQVLKIGATEIKVIATPGHTDCCVCYKVHDLLFTGDTLLIRGTGRTDFQQGSAEKLYDSVHQKLFILPDDTKVYPGHDYKGQTASTIGLEKKLNARLGGGKSKAQFVQIMKELQLSPPKNILKAVPANLACGQKLP